MTWINAIWKSGFRAGQYGRSARCTWNDDSEEAKAWHAGFTDGSRFPQSGEEPMTLWHKAAWKSGLVELKFLVQSANMPVRAATVFLLLVCVHAQERYAAPKIWDDAALADWATPIAALGVRPAHFTSAEYYAAPVDNLITYPVYRPDREPAGYWEWLQKQKPQPLVEVGKARTREEWIKLGETVFEAMDDPAYRIYDPAIIATLRDIKSWDKVATWPNGTSKDDRWVVTDRGLAVTSHECSSCHGSIPIPSPPGLGHGLRLSPIQRSITAQQKRFLLPGDPWPLQNWKFYTTPWAPDERIERWKGLTDAESAQVILGGGGTTVARNHGSPFYTTKIPDIRNVRYNRYIDATGTHRLRGPEDVARYAAFVTGADPMEFGTYKILDPKQRRVPFRYSDDALYAVALFLYSIESAKNPEPPPANLVQRGREIFTRETCVQCHVPPDYTSGKLTLAAGFKSPTDHPNKADIVNISVGTDPGLAMKTRKGTGFYKVPSLRGVWARNALLHDGSVATLEEMFDSARTSPDHVPGGWKYPGTEKRAIVGHPFGLGLNAEDKQALLAFLRSL